MSNDKLREFSEWLDTYRDLPVHEVFHEIVLRYEEALATTEPEPEPAPTGMPELPEPDLLIDADLDSDAPYRACSVDLMRAYGEKCWKAGYKHGAWGGDARDAARYRWLADSNNYYEAINLISDGSLTEDALGKAIDAAMAKG